MDLLTGLLVILGNALISLTEAFIVFQLGKRYGAIGRDEAYKLRDSAMDAIGRFDVKFQALVDEQNAKQAEADVFMRAYLDGLKKDLKKLSDAEIHIDDEDIKRVAQSVSLSIRGSAGAEKQKVTKEIIEAQMASMTPEQLEAMENAEFRKKFRDGILSIFPSKDD